MIASPSRTILCLAISCFALSNAHSQMIVAHRGASHDAPENTLSAFRLAWEQQSDGIEGDFYLTADNQIVCIHDGTTKKTAGKNLTVEKSTLPQLRELEYGAWKDKKFKGESIPTFADVIETVPAGKTFVIELKSKTSIVPRLVEQLAKYSDRNIDLLIIAFDESTAAECKRCLPDIKVHWLTGFEKRSFRTRPTAKQIAATVKRLGVDGVGMKGDRDIITPKFVQTLQANGCREFHVWTIDSVQDAKYFKQLGAMGITTNIPAVIRPALTATD